MPSNVLAYIYQTPWAVTLPVLRVIEDIASRYRRGARLTEDEIRARLADPVWHTPAAMHDDPPGPVQAKKAGRPSSITGDIAVLALHGTIIPRADLFTEISGGVAADRFEREFKALVKDPDVGAIVIDIDSPGGSVQGIAEASKTIFDARGQKPIYAIANHLAASAAYWIGSAADELIVTPSGEVGSIGVYAAHEDHSKALEMDGIGVELISEGKFKTEGHPYGPLDDESRSAIQKRVHEYYDMFTGDVARNRGVKTAEVVNGFGEGRVVGADEAKKLGMVDRIATLDETIARLQARRKGPGVGAVSADIPMAQRLRRARMAHSQSTRGAIR